MNRAGRPMCLSTAAVRIMLSYVGVSRVGPTRGGAMVQRLQEKELQILQNHAAPGLASTKRWRQVFRQRLIVTSLVLCDVLVALWYWRYRHCSRASGAGAR